MALGDEQIDRAIARLDTVLTERLAQADEMIGKVVTDLHAEVEGLKATLQSERQALQQFLSDFVYVQIGKRI